MTDALIVLVTVPSRAEGERIAETVVGERLAACVNVVGPVCSIYRWEGAVCREDEHLLVLKTSRACYPALAARVRALHPYEVPEVIALPVEVGLAAYLAWIAAETKPT